MRPGWQRLKKTFKVNKSKLKIAPNNWLINQSKSSSFYEAKKQIDSISGLQMTDVELDERVTAIEENGGGDNFGNGNVKQKLYQICKRLLDLKSPFELFSEQF